MVGVGADTSSEEGNEVLSGGQLRSERLRIAVCSPPGSLSVFSTPGWLSAGHSAGSLLLRAGV